MRQQRHHHAARGNHHLGARLGIGLRGTSELRDDPVARRRIVECDTEVGQPVDLHAVHRREPIAQPVAPHVLHDPRGELLVDRYQREARAHHAGDVQRRLAQAQHGNVGDLARLLQPGIGDVADQERIEALAHRAVHVLQHLAGLEVLQIAELVADAADLGDAGDMDFSVRVAHLVENAAQNAWIAAPIGSR